MRASDLRRQLTVERASDTPDGAGGAVRVWVADGTVYAAVSPRGRKETLENGRATGMVTHHVTVRHRNDISGTVRFLDGGRIYRVLATEPADPRRLFLRCLCEEEQA